MRRGTRHDRLAGRASGSHCDGGGLVDPRRGLERAGGRSLGSRLNFQWGGVTSSAVNRLAEWGWIATELLIGGSCIAITVAGFARIPTHTHPIDRPTSSATKCPALLSHTSLALAILFALFACHSAYRVIQAAPSCGCYGGLTFPPLVSFVATAAFSVLLFAL